MSVVKDILRLELPARRGYLSIATSFAEQASLAFGLKGRDSLALPLAVEEIVAAFSDQGLPLKMEARCGLYYSEIHLTLPYTELSLEKLNLTASVGGEQDLEAVGWMLAARVVDRLTVENQGQRTTHFRLRKLHPYPELDGEVSMPAPGSRVADIRIAGGQELILFGRRVLEKRRLVGLHTLLLSPPARLADMVESGDFEAILAFSERGDPIAGVIIDRTTPRLARAYGPYLVEAPAEVVEQLFHAALRHLARTPVEGVMTESASQNIPDAEVERLGGRRLRLPDGFDLQLHAYFRNLREDHGQQSWATPWLENYLRDEYRRLHMPRDVQAWRAVPGSVPALPSVISCDFRQVVSECVMRPVLAGQDMTENLASHLSLLDSEGILNAFFELDLGQPFHLAFAQSLQSNGFQPAYLLPCAGKGDLLMLERPAS